MPRIARLAVGGICYHVTDRGNAGMTVFHSGRDYAEFVKLLGAACERVPMRVIAYCLMPNHLHLVLWPKGDGDLGRWMQWLLTSHVRRHHRRHGTDGHIWQGRYKSFPIQRDEHLLTVLRYVERNPQRAGLVARAQDWQWSSLSGSPGQPPLHAGPVPRGRHWLRWVNEHEPEQDLIALRRCAARGAPFGARGSPVPAVASDLSRRSAPEGGRRKAQADPRTEKGTDGKGDCPLFLPCKPGGLRRLLRVKEGDNAKPDPDDLRGCGSGGSGDFNMG